MHILQIRYDSPTTGNRRSIWIRGANTLKLSKLALEKGLTHLVINGEIEVSTYHFSGLVEIMNLHDIAHEGEDAQAIKRLKDINIPEPLKPKSDIVYPEFKLQPYQPQKEALMYGLEKERMLLADLMGAGKTSSAIIMSEYLKAHYQFKHVLIINGVYNNQFNWEKEIEKFSSEDSYIIGSRILKSGKNKGKRRIGPNPEKVLDLEEDRDAFYLITNVHSLRDKRIVDAIVNKIKNGDIGFVVVDEIHYCASTKSSQGKGLNELRPRFRLGMSGTPFNDPTDMYAIERWLGTTYRSFEDYKNLYGNHVITDKSRAISRAQGRQPHAEYIFSEHDAFKKDIDKFMLRRTDTIKGLPSIVFKDDLVEFGREQRNAYDGLSENKTINKGITSLEDLEKEYSKGTYMEERRAITAPHTLGIKEDIKLERTIELLEEIIANGKTAIVFGFFVETVNNYAKELEKAFPKQGNYVKQDTEDVFAEVDGFQNGKGSFILGGVKKIGTGFTMTRADYVIYVDRPATWNDYEQSFMRAWRNGRTKPVTVIKILAIDTWDDKMSFNILERKKQSDAILGGVHDGRKNVVDGRHE